MKTIVVDDEEFSMRQFELECSQMPDIQRVGTFTSSVEALDYAMDNPVDFALLDIEMPEMKGIELAKRLREINPDMIIIFVSGYSDYVVDALKMKSDYYVLKPYSSEDIIDALKRAKLLAGRQRKAMFIRTFGRFNVFVDDKLVKFSNAKSKELLALCVDHVGGTVTMEEAIDKLWPDKDYDTRVKALYRKAIIGIHSVLEKIGMNDVFTNNRGVCNLEKNLVECDYFDYLEKGKNSKYIYEQEYMFEYSWAEETNARLQALQKKKLEESEKHRKKD